MGHLHVPTPPSRCPATRHPSPASRAAGFRGSIPKSQGLCNQRGIIIPFFFGCIAGSNNQLLLSITFQVWALSIQLAAPKASALTLAALQASSSAASPATPAPDPHFSSSALQTPISFDLLQQPKPFPLLQNSLSGHAACPIPHTAPGLPGCCPQCCSILWRIGAIAAWG